MIPLDLLRCEGKEPFLYFLVDFVSLLGEEAFLDNSQRVFGKHVANLLNDQALLRFCWNV